MRKKIAFLMISLIALSCLILCTEKAYAEDDVTAPAIVSLDVDKTSVTAGDTVTFTMVVEDESNIKLDNNSYIVLALGNNNLYKIYFTEQDNGTLSGSITVDESWKNGGYDIVIVNIVDEFGNITRINNKYGNIRVYVRKCMEDDSELIIESLTVDKTDVGNGDTVSFTLRCKNNSVSNSYYPYLILENRWEPKVSTKTVHFEIQEDGSYIGTANIDETWYDGDYYVKSLYTKSKNFDVTENTQYQDMEIVVNGCQSMPFVKSLVVDNNQLTKGETATFSLGFQNGNSLESGTIKMEMVNKNDARYKETVSFIYQSDDTYKGSFYATSRTVDGEYYVSAISYKDNKGYSRVIKNYSELTIRISGCIMEREPPVLLSLSVDKTEAIEGDVITFLMEADDETGIDLSSDATYLRLRGYTDDYISFIKQMDGTYKGEVTVTKAWRENTRSVYYVILTDVFGNKKEYWGFNDVKVNSHVLGTPSFSWSDDASKCIMTRSCTSHPLIEYSFDMTVTSKVTKTATCIEKGTTTYTAQYGQFSTTKDLQNVMIDSSNHCGEIEIRNKNEVTCTEDGYTGDKCCKGCGEILEKGETIPATGHETEIRNKAEATCTEDGYTGDKCCKGCGEILEKGETIPATGHETEIRNKAEATCTTDGYTGDEYCTKCNKVIKKGTVIPATGHETEIRNIAVTTCTTDGYTGDEYCTKCNKLIKIGTIIEAPGHKSEIRNRKYVTCTTDGYSGDTYCLDCGELLEKGETIKATGHSPYTVPAVSATCTRTGNKSGTKCSVCGKILSGCETIPALPHKEVIIDAIDSTTTTYGRSEGRYCSNCGTTLKSRDYIPPLTEKYSFKNAVEIKPNSTTSIVYNLCPENLDRFCKFEVKKLGRVKLNFNVTREEELGYESRDSIEIYDSNADIVFSKEIIKFNKYKINEKYLFNDVLSPDTYYIVYHRSDIKKGNDGYYPKWNINISYDFKEYSINIDKDGNDSQRSATSWDYLNIPVVRGALVGYPKDWNDYYKITLDSKKEFRLVSNSDFPAKKEIYDEAGNKKFYTYYAEYDENGNVYEKDYWTESFVLDKGTWYIRVYGGSGSYALMLWDASSENYSNEWVNGKWYDANGSQTYPGTLQWRNNATGWWVEDTSGWYPTNKWQKIDGIWYFFKPDGYMASNEYYNGYWFNSDGSWDDKYLLSWKSNSTGWWVEDISGWWPQSSWLKIDGYWYYFDASGYMVTSQYVDGWWIDSDGVCR